MAPTRTILHVDLDAFFAAVEQRDNPSLRGKPVLVGGSSRRAVVAAASYEAREYGVHSAMPMAEALRRCPRAIVVSHDFARYAEASQQFTEILHAFSPDVEPISIDEAFVDVTKQRRLHGDGPTIAHAIRRQVREKLRLTASIGVAPNKFVAKIASDIGKPNGLVVVGDRDVLSFLHPLPVSRLWGVGTVTQNRLAELGLNTIGDIAGYPAQVLQRQLGDNLGCHLTALANGIDNRGVEDRDHAISIGHEETFEHDLANSAEITKYIVGQADRVAARLRKRSLRATIVCLKIKYANFKLVSRRRTLDDPTSDGRVIAQAAVELLRQIPIDGDHGKTRRVRLCGVSAAGLEAREAPRQLTLNEHKRAKGERLGDALDAIQDRFGALSIHRAVCADRTRPPHNQDS